MIAVQCTDGLSWVNIQIIIIIISELLHPESSLPSNSISLSTIGTEITSDLQDISLLSLDGICEFVPGLRDSPCKSKDGFFFNTSGATFTTWEHRSRASSGIEWLACTK